MLHYLRIAATALSLTACMLLIALWVRSYWWADDIYIPVGQQTVEIYSYPGHVWWFIYDVQYFRSFQTISVEAYVKLLNENGQDVEFATAFHLDSTSVRLPYWFLLLVNALLTAAPWIPSSKRFSLCTLLIATTLVAIGLGAVIYLAR